jgi:hypothetical protein
MLHRGIIPGFLFMNFSQEHLLINSVDLFKTFVDPFSEPAAV